MNRPATEQPQSAFRSTPNFQPGTEPAKLPEGSGQRYGHVRLLPEASTSSPESSHNEKYDESGKTLLKTVGVSALTGFLAMGGTGAYYASAGESLRYDLEQNATLAHELGSEFTEVAYEILEDKSTVVESLQPEQGSDSEVQWLVHNEESGVWFEVLADKRGDRGHLVEARITTPAEGGVGVVRTDYILDNGKNSDDWSEPLDSSIEGLDKILTDLSNGDVRFIELEQHKSLTSDSKDTVNKIKASYDFMKGQQ